MVRFNPQKTEPCTTKLKHREINEFYVNVNICFWFWQSDLEQDPEYIERTE